MEHRIKLTVAYLGDCFHGWQRQSGARTVQGEIERALRAMTGAPAAVVGAGRTDAGVHAAAQVAHVDLPAGLEPDTVVQALNGTLDPHIRIVSAAVVSTSFHARHDARGKLYRYRIRWRPPRLPWAELRAVTVPRPIEAAAVEPAMARLIGNHDMASFSVPQQGPTVRTLHRAWIEGRRAGLVFNFVGDGFLRFQVRRMVGALLEVGSGLRPVAEIKDLIARPQPGARIRTAPARGLTLERVYYRTSPMLEADAAPDPNSQKSKV